MPRIKSDGTQFRRRGEGCLYRTGTSKIWYLKFTDKRGLMRWESTKTTSKEAAEKIRRQRIAERDRDDLSLPIQDRVTIRELFEDVVIDYRAKGQRSISHITRKFNKHLAKTFGGDFRASKLTTYDVQSYIASRKAEGAQNGTINLELALLRRCLILGTQATPKKVRDGSFPKITMLKGSEPRCEFFEPGEVIALEREAARIGLWMRTYVAIALSLGWRVKAIFGLKVSDYDRIRGTLRQDASLAKNKKTLIVAVGPELRALLDQCVIGKERSDFLLTRDNGRPVRDFYRAWCEVCVRASVGKFFCKACGSETAEMPGASKYAGGLRYCPKCQRRLNTYEIKYAGKIRHSFRRTFVKDSTIAGIAEKTQMTIGGWKTRSVFDRYSIYSTADSERAALALEKKRANDREILARLQSSVEVSVNSTSEDGKLLSTSVNSKATVN